MENSINNQSIISSTDFSGNPSPEPEELIIKAEYIHQFYKFKLRLDDNILKLKIIHDDEIYYKEISQNSSFWIENNKFFQNNYDKFCIIMKKVFIDKDNEIQLNIIKESLDKLKIELIHHGIFDFHIHFPIQKQEDKLDIIQKEIIQLKNENLKLQNIIYGLIHSDLGDNYPFIIKKSPDGNPTNVYSNLTLRNLWFNNYDIKKYLEKPNNKSKLSLN